jgi:hypothetical protein
MRSDQGRMWARRRAPFCGRGHYSNAGWLNTLTNSLYTIAGHGVLGPYLTGHDSTSAPIVYSRAGHRELSPPAFEWCPPDGFAPTGVSPPRAASWHYQNLVKDTASS